MSDNEKLEILQATLQWIIERIESESDKRLEGKNAMWKRAAQESVEEAYGALQRIDPGIRVL